MPSLKPSITPFSGNSTGVPPRPHEESNSPESETRMPWYWTCTVSRGPASAPPPMTRSVMSRSFGRVSGVTAAPGARVRSSVLSTVTAMVATLRAIGRRLRRGGRRRQLLVLARVVVAAEGEADDRQQAGERDVARGGDPAEVRLQGGEQQRGHGAAEDAGDGVAQRRAGGAQPRGELLGDERRLRSVRRRVQDEADDHAEHQQAERPGRDRREEHEHPDP